MSDRSAPDSVRRGDRVALADLAESQLKYVTRPFAFAARLREFAGAPDDLHRYLLEHTPFRPASLRGSMQFAAHATRAAGADAGGVRERVAAGGEPLVEAVPGRFDWPDGPRERLGEMAAHGDRALAGDGVPAGEPEPDLPALCDRAADALREAPDEYAALLADRDLTRAHEPRGGEVRPLLAAVGLVTAGTVLLLREDDLGGRCLLAGVRAWPGREFVGGDATGGGDASGQARLTEF